MCTLSSVQSMTRQNDICNHHKTFFAFYQTISIDQNIVSVPREHVKIMNHFETGVVLIRPVEATVNGRVFGKYELLNSADSNDIYRF